MVTRTRLEKALIVAKDVIDNLNPEEMQTFFTYILMDQINKMSDASLDISFQKVARKAEDVSKMTGELQDAIKLKILGRDRLHA